jgi:hypothetical protein
LASGTRCVDIEIAGHCNGLAGVGIDPTAGIHNAPAGIAEENRDQALFDQHLRSCVLTVAVGVVPRLPVVTVIGASPVGTDAIVRGSPADGAAVLVGAVGDLDPTCHHDWQEQKGDNTRHDGP